MWWRWRIDRLNPGRHKAINKKTSEKAQYDENQIKGIKIS
jgi:hypothetical protein